MTAAQNVRLYYHTWLVAHKKQGPVMVQPAPIYIQIII
jgi:hypothetical protein